MKGYAILIVIVAVFLLLLPMLALPRAQATDSQTYSVSPTSNSTTQNTASDTVNDATQDQAVFKILTNDIVTTLSCREFLIRILAFEMSPEYHTEALKAQAVAAYTYYGRRQLAQKGAPDASLSGADFKAPDDTFPQEYTADKLRERWGSKYDTYYNKLCAAVDTVIGKHMTYNGEWIDACYFAISNGSTESAKAVWGAEVPYLQAIASPGDKLAANYETKITLSAEQIKAALVADDADLTLPNNPAKWFGEAACSDTGMVLSIPIGGKPFTGTALRSAFGLRSATFRVTYTADGFCFTVRGYGHGVGLSQYGADHLARQGYTWQEILQYYYTGIAIV